ncbi:tetratricopeptide repeat protein, partial [Planctomycetota bacterium]
CVFSEAETLPAGPLPSRQYIMQAKSLRLQRVHLRLPAGVLLDCTGKNDPEESDWQVRFAASPKDPTLWRLQMKQTSSAVRRQADYWIFVPAAAGDDMGPMEPVFATETAYDVDSGTCIFRRQSIDWSIRFGETVNTVVMPRTAPWVLQHLEAVFDMDILALCNDYFWHNPRTERKSSGFSDCIACNDRALALDPQAIELYTMNAWLLWSDWVSWTVDPNKVWEGKDNVDKAVRLIQKGRAANPSSAAFHLDAANTLFPLAQHHRSELMDFVIRYYHHAEKLATEKAMRLRICNCLGHRYRAKDNKEEAIRWYRAALELDPEDKVAIRHLKKLDHSSPEENVENSD